MTQQIPQLPTKATPVVDPKTGVMSDVWHNYHKNLTQYLASNVNQEGFQMPPQPSSTLTILNATQNAGKILYLSDLDLPAVNVAGTYKQIVTSALP
jgi:hypothetical protein